MNIISGETIQLQCDLMIGTSQDFSCNPKIRDININVKIIYNQLIKSIDNPSYCNIFCYTHVLANNDIVDKLNKFLNPFYLYLHNSDENFNLKHLNNLKEVSNLKHIYTQNMDVIDVNVSPLPIGLANSMWIHGDKEELLKNMNNVEMNSIKTNKIYFNFSVQTNKNKRKLCKDIIENKKIKWIPKNNYKEYLKILSTYKFAICPEGNGLDTHRFWECLYLKVIPICLKNNLTEHYSKTFPVVLLEDWEDLEPTKLIYENYIWDNYHKLDISAILNTYRNGSIDSNVYQDPEFECTFDIVIPVGPNDMYRAREQVEYTKRNVIGYRNIYMICFNPNEKINGTISIDEKIFPFTIDTIIESHGKSWRNGWYLQQLLKLYAGFVVPGILDTYLVIDSDTFFMNPVRFIQDNKCCYNYGSEKWGEYFAHMKRMHPSLEKMEARQSGICHHMIFEREKLDKLFKMVELHHNNEKKFYEIFLDCVQKKYRGNGSGASEYEMYYNYLLKYHKDDIIIRALKWKDASHYDKKMDYVSIHWHKQTNGCMKKRSEMIEQANKMRNAVTT